MRNKQIQRLVGTGVCVALFIPQITEAQAAFTEVTDTGDLGTVYNHNFGASWGDFDKDGDMDLFLSNSLQQGNGVFRNNGDMTFTRLTATDIGDLGTDAGDTSMGVWADIDNDGDMDVVVINYSMASSLADYNNPATAAQPDRLYLNNGDGIFARQADTLFGPSNEFSSGVGIADFDGNGFLDILVTTWPLDGNPAPDVLYQNNGNLSFSRVAGLTSNTIGASGGWFDYDGDGDLDILVPDNRRSRAVIYEHSIAEGGINSFAPVFGFKNGTPTGELSMNADLGDYDNDGDLDFFVTHFDQSVELYTNAGDGNFTKGNILEGVIDSTRGGAWVDYDNDGDLDMVIQGDWGRSQHDYLLVTNDGNGGFASQVFLPAPSGDKKGRPAAIADINNDGFMDLFIAFYTEQGSGIPDLEQDRLWTNNGNGNHWLKLSLEGTASNRSAIGATVKVRANINGNDVWQMREVRAGGSLFVQHDSRPNFGLGNATVAATVRIEWPSGTVQELSDVAVDQILPVTEPLEVAGERVAEGMKISWPASAHGFELVGADDPIGPWTPATEEVTVNNDQSEVTVPTEGDMKLFKLQRP